MRNQRKGKTDKRAYFGSYVLPFLFMAVSLCLLCFLSYKKDAAYLNITVENEEVTEVSFSQKTARISWQRDIADQTNYLFLPAFADLSGVRIRTDGAAEITLDGKRVTNRQSLLLQDFQPGSHEIRVGEKSVPFVVMQSENLDAILIDLAEPLSFVQENPENSSSGRMEIYTEEGESFYQGKIERMRMHGNSALLMGKKSFSLRLSEKSILLGDDRSKKYLLISNAFDGSFLRNKLFYDMADAVGLNYSVDSKWVDLYVGGIYQGMYLLTDKIDISSGMLDIGNLEKQNKKVNPRPVEEYSNYTILAGEETVLQGWNLERNPSDISGGYLLEIDYEHRYVGEPSKFKTEKEEYIVIKNPAFASAGQAVYIYDFVQAFEDALYAEDGINETGESWQDYIDLDSFAKRYVLDEISKNIDAGASSTFFYKPQRDDTLYAGPVWDYDLALANAKDWGDKEVLNDPAGFYANRSSWSAELYEKKEFYEEVKKVYEEDFEDYLNMLLDEGITEYADYIAASAKMDNACYSNEGWEEEVDFVAEFLGKRKTFLDENWLNK